MFSRHLPGSRLRQSRYLGSVRHLETLTETEIIFNLLLFHKSLGSVNVNHCDFPALKAFVLESMIAWLRGQNRLSFPANDLLLPVRTLL